MKFDIIGKRYWFFALSTLVMIPGFISIAFQGFNLGIDFTGGTLLDLQFSRPVTVTEVRAALQNYNLENSTIQLAGSQNIEASPNVFIRTHVLSDDERRNIMAGMEKSLGSFDTLRVEKVGAVIGSELTKNAIYALLISWVLMIVYITYRFEFKFAVSGILAIVHDLIVVIGIFSLLHKEIDATFVAAILTICGYSINDTIVIFDRIRENQKIMRKASTEDITNTSVTQTMARSINTVATVLLCIMSVYIFVPSIRELSFPLFFGIGVGCYSSIFIASPMWVFLKNRSKKARA